MPYTVKEKKALAKAKGMRYLQMNGVDIFTVDMVGFVFSHLFWTKSEFDGRYDYVMNHVSDTILARELKATGFDAFAPQNGVARVIAPKLDAVVRVSTHNADSRYVLCLNPDNQNWIIGYVVKSFHSYDDLRAHLNDHCI